MAHDYMYTRGVLSSEDLAYVLSFVDTGGSPPIDVTQLIQWTHSEIGVYMVGWQATGLDIRQGSPAELFVVGGNGEVLVGSSDGFREELIEIDGRPAGVRGPLRGVAAVGEVVVAFGMGPQCYARREKSWSPLDIASSGDEPVSGVNAVAGFSEDDLYAVGWGGSIWHLTGDVWRAIESPTNLKLEHVTCGADGVVYAVGQAGTIVRGRGEVWELVEQDDVGEQFWSSCWYDGRLCVATRSDVFSVSDSGELREMGISGEFGAGVTTGWLASAGEVMWSIGAKDIFRTEDGASWSRVNFETRSRP